MNIELRMPKAGLTNTEGTISEWIVPESAHVKKGETILRAENEKSVFDFESPSDGILHRMAEAGSEIKVGGIMGVLAESEAEYQRLAQGETGSADTASKAIAEMPAMAVKQTVGSAEAGTKMSRVRISPYARKLAEKNHIDIAKISGTGPAGRVVAKDIEGFAMSAGSARADRPATGTSGMILLDVTNLAALTDRLNRNGAGLACGDLLCAAAVKAAGGFFSGGKPDLALTYVDDETVKTSFLQDAGAMTPRKFCASMLAAKNGAPSEESADGLEIVDLTDQAVDGLLYAGTRMPLTVSIGRISETAVAMNGKVEIRSATRVCVACADMALVLKLLKSIQRYAAFPESILY